MAEHAGNREQRRRGDRWLLLLVLVLFLVGIGIRGYGYVTRSSLQTGSSRNYTQKAFPDGLNAEQQPRIPLSPSSGNGDRDLLKILAPYLTEGGLSFFLGFCIGYFLRLVAKTMMFVVGAVYCCLILLSHYGIITVDWGSFQTALHQLLLNTQTHIEGLGDLITVGLPSITMGVLGIWRGIKKS
ncbi:hypothetical protein GF339_03430 [candidate division KSB3 bacterium]|uniref:Uncharacterized protein n=1 Tax=candidate division KSB3 bacterium TaxID=2044937 RepID=A0A9D5Q4D7_9BACT|nr:hypothetical protein [candidate division KSB3 bacterium]MBD3323609.1 hypothetical protein [candidate division KSB3 bacterium]